MSRAVTNCNVHSRRTYLNHKWLWLALQLLVFHHSHRSTFYNAASQEHLQPKGGRSEKWCGYQRKVKAIKGGNRTVLLYGDGSSGAAYLPHQFGLARVGDVVLADVTVQPIAEVEKSVIQ